MATSFIIQKNLGTFGDSGALVTNNPDIDLKVRKLRNHGSNQRNVHSFGFNSRLDDLHAGILSAKLKHIDQYNDQRRAWAARYTAGLKECTTFDLPVELPGYRHVFHLYVIEPSSRNDGISFWTTWSNRESTPKPTTQLPFISNPVTPGARGRASS